MSSVVRPSTPDDEAQIIDLLMRAFCITRDNPLVAPALIRWKYWQARDDCPEARSLVAEKDGRVVAHVGLWPVAIHDGEKRERGAHMIDWASDKQAPGAGVSLLQRVTRSYDFVYSIGGSDITESILPKFGFRTVGTASTFARPIRPWRQALHHQSRNLRLPVRVARNVWWSISPGGGAPRGWTVLEGGVGDAASRERGPAFFDYLGQCPSAGFQGFQILREGAKFGYLSLSMVGRQARIGGIWLEGGGREEWRAAFVLAQATAIRSGACEVIARTASEDAAAGAVLAGMRRRREVSVFLYRKGREGVPLGFQLADNDAVFFEGPRAEFLT